MTRMSCCALMLVALASAHRASAQSLFAGEGSHVRIVTARGGPSHVLLAGTLVSITRDTIVIRGPGATNRLAIDSTQTLQLRVGQKRYWLPGALIGVAVGAVLGYTGTCHDDNTRTVPGVHVCNDLRPLFAMLLGGLGGGAGALIGALVVRDEWRSLERPWSR